MPLKRARIADRWMQGHGTWVAAVLVVLAAVFTPWWSARNSKDVVNDQAKKVAPLVLKGTARQQAQAVARESIRQNIVACKRVGNPSRKAQAHNATVMRGFFLDAAKNRERDAAFTHGKLRASNLAAAREYRANARSLKRPIIIPCDQLYTFSPPPR